MGPWCPQLTMTAAPRTAHPMKYEDVVELRYYKSSLIVSATTVIARRKRYDFTNVTFAYSRGVLPALRGRVTYTYLALIHDEEVGLLHIHLIPLITSLI